MADALAGIVASHLRLDPHATEFFRDWDQVAGDTVAMLRAEAGRNPYDRRLTDLIGELSTRSEDFRHRWPAHNVRIHTTGIKLLHHPVVGDLDLPFDTFPPRRRPQPGPPHLHRRARLTLPGRPELLASWAATNDTIEQPAPANDSQPTEPADSTETPD
jgi:hypothetical protein